MGTPQRRPRAQTVLPEPDGGKSLFNDSALGSVLSPSTLRLPEVASVPRKRGDLIERNGVISTDGRWLANLDALIAPARPSKLLRRP